MGSNAVMTGITGKEGVLLVRGRRLIMRMALLPLVAAAATVAVIPAATAQDRPTGVAFVKVANKVVLQPDGSLIVSAQVRCEPGWSSSDLSIGISQGSSGTSGDVVTSVPCDDHWHSQQLVLPPGSGPFRAGKAGANAQFLVFNVQSGDPAAGHDMSTVRIVAA
jgi:hypothetical protein